MKICYLTYNLDPAMGWGRYSSDLISEVKKSGHQVVVLTEDNDDFGGIKILGRGFKIFLSAYRARKYLRDCDIIHALDGYPFGIIAALGGLGLDKKLIINAVGTYAVAPLYSLKTSLFLKYAYKKANQVIAISDYTKKKVLKKVALKNIKVVNLGFDFDKFYKPRLESPEKFILSVGPLKYLKGYHISIPAFAMAKKTIPDLKYKVVGRQENVDYFNEIKNLTIKYRLEKDVEFLSNISDEDLSMLYQQASLFISISTNIGHHFNGFGLVFLEAAAAGLPVIGTLSNGNEDAIKNGFNGLLVEQNNVKKTAKTIINLLENKARWKYMSKNSYLWAKKHDLENIVEKYLQIYEKEL